VKRPLTRKPRTRAQLLPLPAADVARLAMESHMSLALFRCASGSFEHLGVLARTVFLAWLIERGNGHTPEVAPFHATDAALDACAQRGVDGGLWVLDEREAACVAPLLLRYDSHRRRLPRERHFQAWAELVGAINADRSPLPQAPQAAGGPSALVQLLAVCEAAAG
jgi:hypothetical protein